MGKKLEPPTTEQRQNRPWTAAEDDRVLDLWLTGFGKQRIASVMDRSEEAIRTRVQKLATGYEDCRKYQPRTRRARNGVLTAREVEMLEWGLYGMGEKRTEPVDEDHMARILSRPITDVLAYMEGKRSPAKGFGIGT